MLNTNCVQLREELKLTERLLLERSRVLESIPQCPVHGECVPFALEWIERAKHAMAEGKKQAGKCPSKRLKSKKVVG